MKNQEAKNEALIGGSALNVGLDTEMRELMADAMAFRALAAMPSLWSLTLMFGPYLQMDIAWGTGKGVEVRQYETQENMRLALRQVIHKAQAEIEMLNAKVSNVELSGRV